MATVSSPWIQGESLLQLRSSMGENFSWSQVGDKLLGGKSGKFFYYSIHQVFLFTIGSLGKDVRVREKGTNFDLVREKNYVFAPENQGKTPL